MNNSERIKEIEKRLKLLERETKPGPDWSGIGLQAIVDELHRRYGTKYTPAKPEVLKP